MSLVLSTGRARGGKAKNALMTPQERKAQSDRMVEAKRRLALLPKATHGSNDHPLVIGSISLPCFVLDDGTRLLSQRGLQIGIGMSASGGLQAGEHRLVRFFSSLSEKSRENKGLVVRIDELIIKLRSPIHFRHPQGGGSAYGYEATILADACDVILAARESKYLQRQQLHIAQQCEILVRGFARVGIIALIDEATGYQKDRARDELAKILEAFVAKELQPYLRTFPPDYYENLFRFYNLPYPPVGNKSWRPAFFGHITNDVVYERLAPELLPELKKAASKAEKKAKLFQWLTSDLGHPRLREHLASVVAIMKLSKSLEDFRRNLQSIHPAYGETKMLDFGEPADAKEA